MNIQCGVSQESLEYKIITINLTIVTYMGVESIWQDIFPTCHLKTLGRIQEQRSIVATICHLNNVSKCKIYCMPEESKTT